MSNPRRGKTALTLSTLFVLAAYLGGSAAFVRALWFSEGLSSTRRTEPLFLAAACGFLACVIGLVFALVARARIGAPSPGAPGPSRGGATFLIVASALGLAGALFLAFAGTVLSIGVG